MDNVPNTGGTPAPTGTPDVSAQPSFSTAVSELMSKKGWKSVDDIATGYANLEKFTGAPADRHLIIPQDDKDVDGWNKLYNRLGRPETPDKYEFENKSGIELDAETYKNFQALAHKNGISKKAFGELVAAHIDTLKTIQSKALEMNKADFEKCDKALKDKWKADHEKNTQAAQSVAEKFKITELLQKKNLDNDPEVLEMLFNISSMMSEGDLHKGNPSPAADPQQELNEIMKMEAFTHAEHPEHMKVMEKFWRLQGINVTVRS